MILGQTVSEIYDCLTLYERRRRRSTPVITSGQNPKNYFVTAAEADVDDSLKRKRIRVSRKNVYILARTVIAGFTESGKNDVVVVVVCHKGRQSYIPRTVRPRIAKFYTGIHTVMSYSHTGYDVTSYFRTAFTEVRKTAENAASDSFRSQFSGVAFCLPHQLMDILFTVSGSIRPAVIGQLSQILSTSVIFRQHRTVCVPFFAAARSGSFPSGISHRIRVGRADVRKRFWSQLNNSKAARDRPYVSMGR